MNRRDAVALAAVSGALALLDIASKYLAFGLLAVQPSRGPALIPGLLYLTCRKNTGFSWSLLSGLPPQLTAFINLVIIGIVVYYYLYGKDVRHNRLTLAAAALVLSGAAGNLYDRLLFGGVRDFIDVIIPLLRYDYPVFNLADIFVTVGVGLFLVEAFAHSRAEARRRA